MSAELIVPASVGGFWLREMGLYDDFGTLIAVANMAESYKPKLEEGSGRTQTLRMILIVSSAAAMSVIAGAIPYWQPKILLRTSSKSMRKPAATWTPAPPLKGWCN
ncbi:phage tail protein [Serratia proteamaculans]|uniref:phage tail protein n=1 Tax=Serratia proteamaculans TaxID=28151 RepID=UPI0028DB1378|nr:phage tail protein [Serratia proteamaculans]